MDEDAEWSDCDEALLLESCCESIWFTICRSLWCPYRAQTEVFLHALLNGQKVHYLPTLARPVVSAVRQIMTIFDSFILCF